MEFSSFIHDQIDKAVQAGHLLPSARPPQSDPNGDPCLIFDYKLLPFQMDAGKEKVVWQVWSEELKNLPSLSRDIAVNELFIPTADSVRVQYLMSLFIQCGVPCVLVSLMTYSNEAMKFHWDYF